MKSLTLHKTLKTCCFLTFLSVFHPAYAQSQAGTESFVLGNSDFRVNIAANSTHLISSFGPRFDNTGSVSQVTLRGKTFLADPGLVDEFGIEGVGVLGYKEAAFGGDFLKIGVGTLVRPIETEYKFWHKYTIQNLLPVQVKRKGNSLYLQQSATFDRYGYHYQKQYKVDTSSNTLIIRYKIKNTGQRAFDLTHYNHNWLLFSGQAVTPDYHIETKFPISKEKLANWLVLNSQAEQSNMHPAESVDRKLYFESNLDTPSKRNNFIIAHKGNRQQIEIGGDFSLYRFSLYLEEFAICPETHTRLTDIQPQQTRTWTRYYRFKA